MTYTHGFYWFLHKNTKTKQTNEEQCLQKTYKTETDGETNNKSEKGRPAYQIEEEEAEDGAVAATEARTQ